MPKNETELKKLTKNQENLKKFLRYGDIKRLAEITGYSLTTVNQTLKGGKIYKIEVWNALAKLVSDRRREEKELDETIENSIS